MPLLDRYIGGARLEVLKFGMYIMFPISWMYYFGTNLDNRFSVPDFWPKSSQVHKIPYEREDIGKELERLKTRRLALRSQRLAREEEDAKNSAAQQTQTQTSKRSEASA